MKPYKHLALWERYHIRSAIQFDYRPANIARTLKRDPQTIRREIARGGGYSNYDPDHAHKRYKKKRTQKRHPYRFKGILKQKALQLLATTDLEPAGIGPRLTMEHGEHMNISHMTIYRHIYCDAKHGGDLYKHLRTARKKPKRRRKHKTIREFIKNRRFIDQRPDVVDRVERIGDLERDTIVGPANKGAILSIVDRKSSYCWLDQIHRKASYDTHIGTRRQLKDVRYHIKSVTNDNGIEFADHRLTARYLKTDVWFCHPYQTNQSARIEQLNKLVRQYLPKKMDLRFVQPKQLRAITEKLNNRPRKKLGYKTPFEVFFNTFKPLTIPDTS